MTGRYLLAIDQGTSSSRTVIYDHKANVVASSQQEFPQNYPRPGWVEHDPEAIWSSVTAVTRAAMAEAGAAAADVSAIGITDQRETTVIWALNTPVNQERHHNTKGFDRFEADAIVVETNQGGDMVKHTLQSVRRGLPATAPAGICGSGPSSPTASSTALQISRRIVGTPSPAISVGMPGGVRAS